jgi:hypothetical protein
MPTTLGQAFAPTWAGTPPGMSEIDTQLWHRWRTEGLKKALQVYFNVRMGFDDPMPKELSKKDIEFWYIYVAKRADAIAEYDDHIKIIELRDDANANAIGRLMMYKMLWDKDPKINKPVKLLIVTNRDDVDTQSLAHLQGIEIEVV